MANRYRLNAVFSGHPDRITVSGTGYPLMADGGHWVA
jgi:hypothetical protein